MEADVWDVCDGGKFEVVKVEAKGFLMDGVILDLRLFDVGGEPPRGSDGQWNETL